MMMKFNKRLLLLIPFLFPLLLHAQINDTTRNHDDVNRKRLRTMLIVGGSGYVAGMAGLNEIWYKDEPRQSFQFFNDNSEWKQVDKVGHFYSAFYLSYGSAKAFEWCGLPQKKASLYGALTGFLLIAPIELLDGYSAAYGASAGDLMADAAGPLFYLGQQALWHEVRIFPKFSFHQTSYAAKRPDLLGDSYLSEMLKDYNGQTYWLSADMDKFMPFPKWLNIAAGYGAHGMVYANDNENTHAGYNAYRQYYIALDPDLTAIKTRSKVIKTMLFITSMIRIPAPAVEFSKHGSKFHWFY